MVGVREKHSNYSRALCYSLASDGSLQQEGEAHHGGEGLLGLARQVFLPEGYPESVSPDYLEYQTWDTLQAFASSVSGSLATAAVLGGLGVGDSAASPLAATITWLLKDGAGLVGRIVFAAYTGTGLDYDCKRWRMFADVLNDSVLCCELAAPLLPRSLVLPTLCVTGLGRSLVGVAGGATKAAVAQHQARKNNMADLAAKDGSQETLVNLLALCVNLVMLPLVSGRQYLTFLLFLLLALAHIYSNFRAVSCLVINTLNTARLNILLDIFAKTGRVSTPEEVNKLEPVLTPFRPTVNISLGVSLKTVEKTEVETVKACIAREEPYCILHRSSGPHVLISEAASTKHVYRAYIQSYLQTETVDQVLSEIERTGWDLSSLALLSKGYLLKLDK